MKLPLNQIIIGERQRLDLGNLEDLNSMSDKDIGLIQPIVVHKTLLGYELIAGRRRLAKAQQLGWPDIECIEKDLLTETQKNKMEFLEDVARKDRTWQEKCIAVYKLHRMMTIERHAEGGNWTSQHTATFSGFGLTSVKYMNELAVQLVKEPKDEELWNADNYLEANRILNERVYKDANTELERRRLENEKRSIEAEQAVIEAPIIQPSPSQELTDTRPRPLHQMVAAWNLANPHLMPLVMGELAGHEFMHGFWFVGGGNVSDFYGSYQVEYLRRINCLFSEYKGKREVVHLFSGSLPPSEDYTRVGIDYTGEHKADLEIDAHTLSSHLPFNPWVIYADPPYSVEDAEHYKSGELNRARILDECGTVLKDGGFVVWMDQALPIFSNKLLSLVGGIAYIRSTANRFRVICIFQKGFKVGSAFCPAGADESKVFGNDLPN